MSTKKSDEPRSISQQLEEILGKPALPKSEDQESYDELLKLVSQRMEPNDLFEHLEVQEITSNIWGALRFHEMRKVMVDAERGNAIRKLIDPKSGYVSKAASEHLEADVAMFIKGGIREAPLRKAGISPELIRGMSELLAKDNLMVFDRLESNCIATRKTGIRDYDRRHRQVAKDKRLATKAARQKLVSDNRVKLVEFPKLKAKKSVSDWPDD